MPRPKNREASIKVTITATPKFGEYLDDLVAEEDYGSNRAEVARNLVWRAIEDLIHKRVIDRRKGGSS